MRMRISAWLGWSGTGQAGHAVHTPRGFPQRFVLAVPGTLPEAPTDLETAARKVVQAFDDLGARSKPAPLAAAVGELRDALAGARAPAGQRVGIARAARRAGRPAPITEPRRGPPPHRR